MLFSIAVIEHIAWLVGAKLSLSSADAQSRVAQLRLALPAASAKAVRLGSSIQLKRRLGIRSGRNAIDRALHIGQMAAREFCARAEADILLQPELLAGE